MKYGERESEVREEHLVRHIGFAERWLARAKHEVTEGRQARSVLSLMLAEAEVHHARERTLPARAVALPRPSPALMLVGAAVLAALLHAGWTLLLPVGEMATTLSSAPTVVRFRQPGSTLALVPVVAAPQTSTPAAPLPDVLPRVQRVWRNMTRPAPVRPAMVQAPPVAPPAPISVAPVLLTDGDLIDLVIAAERSLRGEKR